VKKGSLCEYIHSTTPDLHFPSNNLEGGRTGHSLVNSSAGGRDNRPRRSRNSSRGWDDSGGNSASQRRSESGARRWQGNGFRLVFLISTSTKTRPSLAFFTYGNSHGSDIANTGLEVDTCVRSKLNTVLVVFGVVLASSSGCCIVFVSHHREKR
jgi:hypothetical protein